MTRDAYVLARCVACGHERKVRAGEVPAGEVPTCDKCFAPMVAVEAVVGPDRDEG